MDARQDKWPSLRQTCFQFSLRALLAITTVSCVAAAIYGSRERREDQLADLVTRFNAAIEDGEFQKALVVAEDATRRFPGDSIPEFMLEKSRYILGLLHPDVGTKCQ